METKITNNQSTKEAMEIRQWLVSYLAKSLELEPEQIETTVSFNYYNLDSALAIELTGDLSNWLGCDLDPMLLYDYPTIEALVKYLIELLSENDNTNHS